VISITISNQRGRRLQNDHTADPGAFASPTRAAGFS